MKAAVYKGEKSIVLEERPTPQAGTDGIIVKVKYCGICGSDVHGYLGGSWPPGTVFGHEAVGTVAEAGAAVTGWNSGDRVAVAPFGPCGECFFCRKGRPNICVHFLENCIGLSPANDGALAEYVRVRSPGDMLHRLPDHTAFEDAVLVEPMAVALAMVCKSRFRVGENVVVVGAGVIGLLGIQFLKMGGARSIAVLEPSPRKRDLALQFGADLAFDLTEESASLREKVAELSSGTGADIVYECAGAPDALRSSLDLVRSGGQVVLVGTGPETPLAITELIGREIELTPVVGYTDEFALSIDFVARNKMNTKPLISDIIKLDDVVEKGFERLAVSNDLVKVVVSP